MINYDPPHDLSSNHILPVLFHNSSAHPATVKKENLSTLIFAHKNLFQKNQGKHVEPPSWIMSDHLESSWTASNMPHFHKETTGTTGNPFHLIATLPSSGGRPQDRLQPLQVLQWNQSSKVVVKVSWGILRVEYLNQLRYLKVFLQ